MPGVADTAKLLASLDLDATPFLRGIDKAIGGTGKLETSWERIGKLTGKGLGEAVKNIERIGLVAGGALVGAVALGAKSLGELERVQNQTAAAIESTGGKAGVSAQQIRDLANAEEDLTTVDDKVVQSGENLLLTFTNISADIFPQATKAMTNMAIAMAGGDVAAVDLKSTAIQLGKALQDPVAGATALRRVGVMLTDQQQEQIKAFVKSGDILSAQKIILQELETEFGKAGEAAGKGPEAAMRRLADAGEELSMALATGVLPVLTKFASWLSTKLRDPETVRFMQQLGDEIGTAGDKLLAWVQGVDWSGVINGAKSILGIAQSVVGMFMGLPDWVKEAVITGWGLNKLTGGALSGIVGELGKGLIKGVLGMSAAVVNINAATVAGLPTGGAGAATAGAAAGGGLAAFFGAAAMTAMAAAAVVAVKSLLVDPGLNAQSGGINQQVQSQISGGASLADLQKSLDAVNRGIKEIGGNDPNNPIVRAFFGQQISDLENARKALEAAMAAKYGPALGPPAPGSRVPGGGSAAVGNRDMDKNLGSAAAALRIAADAMKGAKSVSLSQSDRNAINHSANAARDAINAMRGGLEKLDPGKAIKAASDIIRVYTSGTAKDLRWMGANQAKVADLAAKFDRSGDHVTAAALRAKLEELKRTQAQWGKSQTDATNKTIPPALTTAQRLARVGELQSTANARLGTIAGKDFSPNVTVSVSQSTSISITDLAKRYATTVRNGNTVHYGNRPVGVGSGMT